MSDSDSDKRRRRRMPLLYAVIAACLLITALNVSVDAQNRPFRHYTQDGNTSFTQVWPVNATNITYNAINGDNPTCEWQVGDNNSFSWTCMNKTSFYTCTGNTCTSVGNDGNNYTTALSVNQTGNAYSIVMPRNGANTLVANFTVNATGGSGNLTMDNNITGWPLLAYNATHITNLLTGCAAGYALQQVSNDSLCVQVVTPADLTAYLTIASAAATYLTIANAAATYYPLTNPYNFYNNTTLPLTGNASADMNTPVIPRWNGSAFVNSSATDDGATFTIRGDATVQDTEGNWTKRAQLNIVDSAGNAGIALIRSNSTYLTWRTPGGSPTSSYIEVTGTRSLSYLLSTFSGTSYSVGDITLGSNIAVPALYVDSDRSSVCVNCNDTSNTGTNANFSVKGITNLSGETTIYVTTNTPNLNITNTNTGRTVGLTINRPAVGGLYFTTAGGSPSSVQIGSLSSVGTQGNAINILSQTTGNYTLGDIVLGDWTSSLPTLYISQSSTNKQVGINTSDPNSTLEVNGNASFSGNVHTFAGLFNNGSQVCTAANGLCASTTTGGGNVTGNYTADYFIVGTNSSNAETTPSLSLTNGNVTVAGNFVINDYVSDYHNMNYLGPVWTEFCSPLTSAMKYDSVYAGLISSGTLNAVAGNASHPCITTIRDSTTANGGAKFALGGIINPNSIGINGTENMTAIVKFPSTQDGYIQHLFGLHDSITFAPPSDGCFIYIQQNNHSGQNNQLSGRCVNNGLIENTSNNYTFINNTWYTFNIYINPTSSNVTFSVYNETGSLLWNNSVGQTRIPTLVGRETDFGWMSTQNSTDAAVDLVHLDYMDMKIRRPLRRGLPS